MTNHLMQDRLRRINNVQRDLLNIIGAVIDNCEFDEPEATENLMFLKDMFRQHCDFAKVQVKKARKRYFTEYDM